VRTHQRNRRGFWQSLLGRDSGGQKGPQKIPHHQLHDDEEEPLFDDTHQQQHQEEQEQQQETAPELQIAPNDPIVAYLASASGVVEIDKLDLHSPALEAMKAYQIKVVVPLVSQGELIGLLNLGPRLSQQEYSADDRKLLNDLATQTAPAVQVAQLVRQQQQQAQERERIEQELRVARLIQQTLLPKEVPDLEGYKLAAYYQPAREVGGDFYDFLKLDDEHLGLVVGDVTDKGVPAAIVMATTRTMLRASAQRLDSPGEVLKRVNDVIVRDIPPNMFITCLYAILDLKSGLLRYANAGHDLPYRRRSRSSSSSSSSSSDSSNNNGGAEELRATGMPLGLLPGMSYEEKQIVLQRGDSVLFYSDGLVEAHDPHRQMFGFPRLQGLVGAHPGGATMVDFLLEELARFVGDSWEQEDDITLVMLQRSEAS
jgi:serine phosphatase RsbU (regulator of sigma subunit)